MHEYESPDIETHRGCGVDAGVRVIMPVIGRHGLDFLTFAGFGAHVMVLTGLVSSTTMHSLVRQPGVGKSVRERGRRVGSANGEREKCRKTLEERRAAHGRKLTPGSRRRNVDHHLVIRRQAALRASPASAPQRRAPTPR